ncbi:hypothetical protein K439DRAFT_1610393 [Ramaria rubella]|nr:hypothetical protein K439DRAFT_1610393 [Ramaria rubella]
MAPHKAWLHPRACLSSLQKTERHNRWLMLTGDVKVAQDEYADAAKKIVISHNRSLKWARNQLYMGSRKVVKQRKANLWNGFTSETLCKVNAGKHKYNDKCLLMLTWRAEHEEGSIWNLVQYVVQHHEELEKAYAQLNEEEKEGFRKCVNETRAEKKTMVWVNPKAIQKDMNNMFEVLKQEFYSLEQRTGCKAFYIGICGDVEHHSDPKIYMGPETKKFFKDVLNMNPNKFTMQFEAYIVGGTASTSMVTSSSIL